MTFSFGAAPTPAAANTGFTLSAPPAKSAPAAGGFSFGAPASSAAPTLGGFGAPAATTSAATGFGGFGVPAAATTSTPAAFGAAAATTSAAAPAFGGFGSAATTSTASVPAAGFGGFGTAVTAAPSTAVAPTLGGFGAPAATSAAPAFGGLGTTSTISGPGLGGFGAPAATVASSAGLGGSTTAGGIQTAGQQTVPAEAGPDQAGGGKEALLPAELLATVETLKNTIKEEKSLSSEVSHSSVKAMTKVREETEALSLMVSSLSTAVQNNRSKLEQMKQLCGQELRNVDICVQTRDTPASLQYDNTAPLQYFTRLVGQFEQSMLEYKQAIHTAEQHLTSITSGQSLSQGDIVAAVQKLHQGLTHLAARYQEVHTAVARLKLQYGVAGSRPGVRPPARLAGPSPFLPPADPLTRARRDQQLGQAGPPAQPLGHNTAPAGGFGGGVTGAGAGVTFGAVSSSGAGFGQGGSTVFGASNTSFGASTLSTTGFNATGFGASSGGLGSSFAGGSGTKRGKH